MKKTIFIIVMAMFMLGGYFNTQVFASENKEFVIQDEENPQINYEEVLIENEIEDSITPEQNVTPSSSGSSSGSGGNDYDGDKFMMCYRS